MHHLQIMPARKRARARSEYKYKNVKKSRRSMSVRVDKTPQAKYTMYAGVVPAKKRTVLKYSDIYQLTDTIVGFQSFVFRANSVFDPEQPLGGHQPLGFDQYATFYNNYRVYAATIYVNISQNQSTVPCIVGITPSRSATSYLTTAQLELPGTVTTMVTQDTAGPSMKTLKLTMDIEKFDGNFGTKFDDEHEAQVTANPTAEKFFILWVKSAVGALTVDSSALVEIYYDVEFFNRKDLPTS